MTLAVLELVDAGLTIGDAAGTLVESPAYAVLEPQGAVLGETARARARLQPQRTHTRFWQRLGTEPLHNAPAHTRHHADLAWQQLVQLHTQAGAPEEIVLAVPGSFTREQLAILLGIAERCPFRAVGLVDSALASATQVPLEGDALVHLELQLHQCVLTRIEREDASLVRRHSQVLPGSGLIDLHERWARRIAAAFIQQTRFDPLHDAETEQQLFDLLPDWLARLDAADDIVAELASGAHRHHAKLRAVDLMDAVQPVYAELFEALARESTGASVLLGARVARLPRFGQRLADARVLGADAPVRGGLDHVDAIRSEDRALRFVTRLPAPATVERAKPAPPAATTTTRTATPAGADAMLPTHLLAGDVALPLAAANVLHLHRTEDGDWRLATRAGAQTACSLERIDGHWYAQAIPGQLLRVDGLAVSGRTPLRTGSRIAVEDASELRLIAEARASDAA